MPAFKKARFEATYQSGRTAEPWCVLHHFSDVLGTLPVWMVSPGLSKGEPILCRSCNFGLKSHTEHGKCHFSSGSYT
jgi:hypothetical protein